MYLAPDGEEAEIANAARGYLAEVLPIARLHAAGSADLGAEARRALGTMGWLALAVPGDSGGSGLSAIEHALFFREAGRQCAPADLIAQCLAASVAQGELGRAIASGEVAVALAVADGQAFRLLGPADAAYALSASHDGAGLVPLDGVEARARPSLDPANSLRVCAALPAPVATEAGGRTWRLGQLAAAAMQVGIAEAALDLIVEYAKVRETFGRKIGAWQAVRHPCADMAVRVEAARAQLWFAAAAIKEARSDADAHLDAAKHCANEAALANADTAIQLHGGIGVTDEHDCHLLLKHALVLSRLFGSRRALLGRLLHARVED